jgi:peptidoglycan/xylan/chitin deacetylase (PgdA/CDA1 family)
VGEPTSRPTVAPGDAPPFFPAPPTRLKSIKLGMLTAARRMGLTAAIRDSDWGTRRFLILAYHGIATRDEHEFSPDLYLPLPGLRYRFELLQRGGYAVLGLREALQRSEAGTLPPRAVALTFDDGMHDFGESVVPLLREFNYPATVYVTTYYAVKQVPIFRMACRYLLWVGRERSMDGTGLTGTSGTLTLDKLDARDAALRAIESRLAGGVAEEVATLRRLAERVGVDFDRFLSERRQRVMSIDEIRALPRDLVDVQLHTHRHRVPLREEPFRREIEDNRSALREARPDAAFDGFCYPSGVTDPRFLPWLADLGVTIATTCRPGLVEHRSDRLMLPRLIDSWRLNELELDGWLTGVAQFLPRIPRRSRYQPMPVYD